MGLQDAFITPVAACMNANFKFPPITAPGMPNFVLGCFLSTFAGINFILQFIPPTPSVLPKIKPPDISIFLSAFMSGIMLPPSYPSISLGPLTIPGVGSAPYEFDVGGMLKLMAVMIVLPFMLIVNMITGLLKLSIVLPTLGSIAALFASLTASVGIAGVAIAKFGLCIAKAIISLFTSLI